MARRYYLLYKMFSVCSHNNSIIISLSCIPIASMIGIIFLDILFFINGMAFNHNTAEDVVRISTCIVQSIKYIVPTYNTYRHLFH